MLKSLSFLSALSLILTASSFANTVTLPRDALSVSTVSDIELVSVNTPAPPRSRPGGPQFEMVSVAHLSIGLSGCANQLGPVSVTTKNEADGKITILVSAIEINTKTSMTVRCFAQERRPLDVTLGMGMIPQGAVNLQVIQ